MRSARLAAAVMQIGLPFDTPGTLAPATDAVHLAPRAPHLAPVLVRHPTARRYVLRVRADGTVRITVPRWGSKRDALAFAESQQRWVDDQRRKLEVDRERRRHAAVDPAVARAARERATVELPARLAEFASALGIAVRRVSVRNQRWRWGSCSREGHICLNWRLVLVPPPLRDYVIVHELIHRRRMDHSPKFWKLVQQVLPDWRELRRQLRAHEHLLD